MKLFIEYDVETEFDFNHEQVANDVVNEVLKMEKCPFDTEINILITDNETIHQINKETRDIDRATDVLSFPNMIFEIPSDFQVSEDEMADYIDPETDLFVLGEMILSYDKIFEQAEEYGHSVKREYAFLITHSVLHLCGYDHMTEEDAVVMQDKQEEVLNRLGITRD